jgi:hypothetical protein
MWQIYYNNTRLFYIMWNTSCYYYSSSIGQNICTSNSSNDTIVNIGIIIGIVIESLADISIMICVILISRIIMKKFNSLSTIDMDIKLNDH